MRKPRVLGTRINQMRQRKLTDVSQSLKWPTANNGHFSLVELDEPVNGITDYCQGFAQAASSNQRSLAVIDSQSICTIPLVAQVLQ